MTLLLTQTADQQASLILLLFQLFAYSPTHELHCVCPLDPSCVAASGGFSNK